MSNDPHGSSKISSFPYVNGQELGLLVDRSASLGDGPSSSRPNSAACREHGEPDRFIPDS